MKSWIAAIAFACTATLAHAAPACQATVAIGAWNIQWLGNAIAGKRPAQDADDVASYIASSRVDVLALAEVSATGKDAKGRPRNATLDAAFAALNQSGSLWEYELFPKREGARSPDDQWIGLAWNRQRVQRTGGPWKLPGTVDKAREDAIRAGLAGDEPSTIVFSRWPHAMRFSAGPGLTDWVMVPIHLKSNTDGAGTEKARDYEAELLLDGLSKLAAEMADRDLIVIGDTNMLRADEPAGQRLRQAGFIDCNSKDLETHLPYKQGDKGAPFDRIFLNPQRAATAASCRPGSTGSGAQDFKVFRPGAWEAGMSNRQFRKLLSDHLMVRTALCIGKDDD